MSSHADTIRRMIAHDDSIPEPCDGCRAEQELDALLAENQRLRDALKRITRLTLFEKGNGLVVARQVARAALAGTPSAAE